MIDLIRDFFAANRFIVFSVSGQVFFVSGLAIALQSWRHSRMALARHLKWLAAYDLRRLARGLIAPWQPPRPETGSGWKSRMMGVACQVTT